MISRLNVIVWALNPKYDNLESLVSYLRRYFGEYLENFNIRFTTDLPDQIPDISITPDTRRNIFYAVQEAIHNAVKHSGCSEIGLTIQPHPLPPLSLRRGGWGVRFTITDNGQGFDTVKPGSGGNGLLNMKKRAEELGGGFEIESRIGSGTRISLMLAL
jgi:signal transduction histidine kinase